MAEGIKYLGYKLKSNNYMRSEWQWIVNSFTRKMEGWTSHWISLGGHLNLIMSILQSLPFYRFSLLKFPEGVLMVLRRIIFKFLWRGKSLETKFHLASWETLSRLKSSGGWGIKHLSLFNISLCSKNLWRVLSDDGLWGRIIRRKYLKNILILTWLRSGDLQQGSGLLIWGSLLGTLHFIKPNLNWLVGNGSNVFPGLILLLDWIINLVFLVV